MLVLLSSIALTACTGGGAAFVFYVVVEPSEATKFLATVTTVAKENGMETAEAQVVSDTGDVLKVLEGWNFTQRLWVQSTPLSGDEDPQLCGVYHEPHSDPAQFTLFAQQRFLGSKATAKKLGERVFSELRKAGFDVRRESPVCGTAAIHGRP
ncbi:MAG TPA: hypothetical protein VGI93_22820 [Steroidobacteraceae bacterium]|jgi:hypothetical protein